MTAMVDLRSRVFRKMSSLEKPFNYQFGGLLGYSLEAGPDLVSSVHSDISMGENTELVALQDSSELDDTIDGTTYEIDIAFMDESTILGIESKRPDYLKRGQLKRELEVLEKNSDGRDVVLLAVDEGTNRPSVVEDVAESTEHTVLWDSWYRIADRIKSDKFEKRYEPIRKIMVDMLEDADYGIQFEGLPEPELNSQVFIEWQQQFTNLILDVDKMLQSEELSLNRSSHRGNILSYSHSSISVLEKNHHYQPALVSIFAPFTIDENRALPGHGRESYACMYGNYHDNEVGVFLNLSPNEREDHKEILKEYSEEIADVAFENDMLFRVSRNSHCNYKYEPMDIDDRDEVSSFLERTAGEEQGKRVMIGKLLEEGDSPRETIEEFAREMTLVYDIFYEDGEILGQYDVE
jgi:hypothetical protein